MFLLSAGDRNYIPGSDIVTQIALQIRIIGLVVPLPLKVDTHEFRELGAYCRAFELPRARHRMFNGPLNVGGRWSDDMQDGIYGQQCNPTYKKHFHQLTAKNYCLLPG